MKKQWLEPVGWVTWWELGLWWCCLGEAREASQMLRRHHHNQREGKGDMASPFLSPALQSAAVSSHCLKPAEAANTKQGKYSLQGSIVQRRTKRKKWTWEQTAKDRHYYSFILPCKAPPFSLVYFGRACVKHDLVFLPLGQFSITYFT